VHSRQYYIVDQQESTSNWHRAASAIETHSMGVFGRIKVFVEVHRPMDTQPITEIQTHVRFFCPPSRGAIR